MVYTRSVVARWHRNLDLDAWYERGQDIGPYRRPWRGFCRPASKRVFRLFWLSFYAHDLAVLLALQARWPTSPARARTL